ncbi:hypothetical protein BH11BAC7_BH11BAC7_14270 [soil metagenome]
MKEENKKKIGDAKRKSEEVLKKVTMEINNNQMEENEKRARAELAVKLIKNKIVALIEKKFSDLKDKLVIGRAANTTLDNFTNTINVGITLGKGAELQAQLIFNGVIGSDEMIIKKWTKRMGNQRPIIVKNYQCAELTDDELENQITLFVVELYELGVLNHS